MNDRELDKFIAEKFMDWSEIWFSAVDARGRPPNMDGHFVVPAYSTDLAAAFTVFDRLKEKDPKIMVSCNMGQHGYWVCVYPTVGEWIETDYYESLPKAICEAAKMIIEKS